jgi:UTP:GlnB (protein PII) uridylyltransferase
MSLIFLSSKANQKLKVEFIFGIAKFFKDQILALDSLEIMLAQWNSISGLFTYNNYHNYTIIYHQVC